jgi:ubiquinone/menaquinone biosynthesis C-methylase UbiE
VGVDPSEAAITQGRAAYPNVQFLQGVASALPIEQDSGFDLVVVSSVFHWIDRSTLLRSCAEADRMLAEGGFLVIGDFYPALPERVNYHHRTDVELYTYKQNYAEIFIATRLYTQFASLAFARQGWVCRPDVQPSDRYQVCALKKTGKEGYVPKEFKPDGR